MLQIATCNPEMLANVLQEDAVLSTVLESGCSPVVTSDFDANTSRDKVLSAISLHYCVTSVKAELDNLVQGMQCLGVLAAIRRHPAIFRPCFVADGTELLTAGKWQSN